MSEPSRPLSQPFHLDEWASPQTIEHLEELAEERGVDIGVIIRERVDRWIQRELGS